MCFSVGVDKLVSELLLNDVHVSAGFERLLSETEKLLGDVFSFFAGVGKVFMRDGSCCIIRRLSSIC